MAEQHYISVLPLLIFGLKAAPRRGRDSKERKKPGGNLGHGNLFRLACARHVDFGFEKHGKLFQRMCAGLHIIEVGLGFSKLKLGKQRRDGPDDGNSLRILVGKRS
jgi:hypothetical protein